MSENGSLVTIRGLSHGYMEAGVRRAVLSDLHMSLPKGSFTALVGRSGSGKSTLLNLISGMDVAQAGEISFGGVSLRSLDETARTRLRRTQMGFVFQAFNLIPTLTVLENLQLPMALVGVDERQQRRRAIEMLERLGLADRGGAFSDRLSGGEQQRVAVARALLHEPSLILADEPTGNLDFENAQRVIELLESEGRERGVTVLMVTHDPDFLQAADQVYRLHRGQLHQEERL